MTISLVVVTRNVRAGSVSEDGAARLHAVIEGSLDSVFLLDALRDEAGTIVDLVFADANRRGLDLIGMRREQVIGRELCELLPVNRSGGFVDRCARVIETGRPLEEEFPLPGPNGGRRWLRHQVVKTGDGVAITTRDVTEQRMADEERRQTAEKLAAVVQSSPLAILALDLEGRVTMWNAAAERLFGWTAGELLGSPLPSIPDEEREHYERVRSRALAGREIVDVPARRLRKDGTIVDVSLWLAPLRDAAGRISGHLTIVADTTERRRLEEQVAEAQKMDALGRLAAGVAHDFNNVLTAIAGYAELVLGRLGADEAAIRQDVEQIRTAAESAAGLTRELLAFGRPRAAEVSAVDLAEAVHGMEDFLRHLAGEGVQLVFELSSEACVAHIDRGRLQQVVVNLVLNARDAMPTGGVVRVGTSGAVVEPGDELARWGLDPGGYVALVVADDGVGMDAQTVEHAFEPFFTTKQEARGTGLGLAIVYRAVTQGGGRIRLTSTPGEGTVATVYLPAVELAAT